MRDVRERAACTLRPGRRVYRALRTLLVGLVASLSPHLLVAQVTVVKPLDPVPPRRLLYHPPRLLSCPRAQYPDSLKRRSIGGRVVLEVVVDTLGHVMPDRIVVRESSDNGLNRAATVMALGCRFAPARVGRTPVAKMATIPVDFAIVRR
jgi:TonB family protein